MQMTGRGDDATDRTISDREDVAAAADRERSSPVPPRRERLRSKDTLVIALSMVIFGICAVILLDEPRGAGKFEIRPTVLPPNADPTKDLIAFNVSQAPIPNAVSEVTFRADLAWLLVDDQACAKMRNTLVGPLAGSFTAEEALKKLLDPIGLPFEIKQHETRGWGLYLDPQKTFCLGDKTPSRH